MKYIEKKSVAELNPITGSVVDTWNVKDKVKNAPSMRIIEEALANIEGGGGSTDLTAIREQLDTNTTNISDLTTNLENYKDAVGLGEEKVSFLNGVNIDNIDLNGFAYLVGCNAGTSMTSMYGYLIQIVHSADYRLQIYCQHSETQKFQYRKKNTGTWGNWVTLPTSADLTTVTNTANTAKSTADSALSKANTNATNISKIQTKTWISATMNTGFTEVFNYIYKCNGVMIGFMEFAGSIAPGATASVARLPTIGRPSGAFKGSTLMCDSHGNSSINSCLIDTAGIIDVTNISSATMTKFIVQFTYYF